MLRELQALALVVRAQIRAIQHRGPFRHPFVDQPPDCLAVVEREGGFFRLLDVSVPFHCALMDPIEPAFREGARALVSRAPDVPF